MIQESTNRTTDKVAAAAHEAVDKMAASADQIEERVRHSANRAQDQARDAADRAQRMSEDVVTDVRHYVYEHPVASLGMAFAAGLVFSALLRR
ncbi:MAG: DUF883 family protein [Gammaproteobacteria bacterium]|nr:DUF883 family protein [Gammaproteobacteria bacterium]